MTPEELDAIEASTFTTDLSRELAAALREAWAEVEQARDEIDGYVERVGYHGEKLSDAEAAIARVRALCDDAARSDRSINGYGYVLLRPLRAALDGEAS